jgi:lysophospholipase L1-like esterase
MTLLVLGAILLPTVAVSTHAYAATPNKVMIVGDSISQGSAGDFTWRYRLWRHLQSTGASAIDFVGDRTDVFDNVTNQHGSQAYLDGAFDKSHHASWGRLLSDEKATVGSAITSTGADTVLVLLGINDVVWLNLTPAQVAEEMRQFVVNARAARPSVNVVIGHLLARFDPWSGQILNQATVTDINARFDTLAGQLNTATSKVVTARTDASWLPKNHTWDGTHPNPTGEVRIAAGFANALAGWGVGTTYGPVPSFVPWPSAGTTPTAVPGSGEVHLSWPATPGATGYFIEQRVPMFGETEFSRLPYPVSGTAWTAGLLVPGSVVHFRIVPTKGLSTGVAGPSASATVGGSMPMGRPTLTGAVLTEHSGRLTWTAVAGASGYLIEQIDLTRTGAFQWFGSRLPFPVSGTSFEPGLLESGHWYAYRVVPVNGLIEGLPSNVVEIRTKGLPSTPSAGVAYLNYYALGDSYSSGIGAGGPYTGGDCLRTTKAWPYKMSFIGTTWHWACAGETIPVFRADQLANIGPKTYPLITVTIGGNDVGFMDHLIACTLPGAPECTGFESSIAAQIDGLRWQLAALYGALRTTVPGADIVVGGYPLLVTATGACNPFITSVLTGAERAMIRRLAQRLDNVVTAAAQAAGVISAVPQILSRFAGHEACSSNGEWINQTTTSAPPYLVGSFHPNAAGQLAYALAFSDRLVALNTSGMVR